MEIKTLAQILAETPSTAEGNQKQSQREQKTTKKRKQPWAANTAAQGFAASKKPKNSRFNQKTKTNSKTKINSEAKTNSDFEFEPKSQAADASQVDGDFFEDTAAGAAFDQRQTENVSALKKRRKKKKSFHPASPYQPKIDINEPAKEVDPNSIKSLLAQVKAEGEQADALLANDSPTESDPEYAHVSTQSAEIDNLPAALKAYLKTPEQRQAEIEAIKANSRLRWLAFYYLSRREHSAGELRQKLLDKEQDPAKIDELLEEFQEKGYQSDYRTAIMLIREGIRKRRGRVRIKNDFYKRKVDMPTNIDELIDMAMEDNEAFVDVLSDNDLVEGVDWLRLAVEARVKKYGADIPHEQKDKARQLRFLQYRGFKPNICFEAINYNLDTLDERF